MTILFAAILAVPVACGDDGQTGKLFGTESDGSADGALGSGGSGLGAGGASAGGRGSGTGGGTAGGSSAGGAATGGGPADGSAGDGSLDGGPDAAGPIGCRSSLDCSDSDAGLYFCNVTTGDCVGCQTDGDCATDQECVAGTCSPLPPCTTSVQCRTDPSGKTICDTVAGACVECLVPTDCGATGFVCVDRTCRPECISDNDCSGTLLCDPNGGGCVPCANDAACDANQFCAAGQCVPDSCVGGTQSCSDGVVIECNEAGSGVNPVTICSGRRVCVEHGATASCDLPGMGDAGVGGATGAGGGANDAGPEAGNPGCSNGTRDGAETDTDCGGPDCRACGTGDDCDAPRDCASFVCRQPAGCIPLINCNNTVCAAPTCSDNIRNGNETDTDCGGPTCAKCGGRDSCATRTDCLSGRCTAGICEAPTCDPRTCQLCLFGACCVPVEDRCGCNPSPLGGPCN